MLPFLVFVWGVCARLQTLQANLRLTPHLGLAFVVRLERVKGIEPSSSAWKAVARPLSYTRLSLHFFPPNMSNSQSGKRKWWRELDSNQRRHSQRIYSPSPLATRASLHKHTKIKKPSKTGGKPLFFASHHTKIEHARRHPSIN